jgi:hypothetical protein
MKNKMTKSRSKQMRMPQYKASKIGKSTKYERKED